MKQCLCDRKDRHLEDFRPGDTKNGEIHGAAYCRLCGAILMCDFCTPENRRIASVVTRSNYACWEHGSIALNDMKGQTGQKKP